MKTFKEFIKEVHHEGQNEPGLRSKARRKITRLSNYSGKMISKQRKAGVKSALFTPSGEPRDRSFPELGKDRKRNIRTSMKYPDVGGLSLTSQIKGSKNNLKQMKKMFKGGKVKIEPLNKD